VSFFDNSRVGRVWRPPPLTESVSDSVNEGGSQTLPTLELKKNHNYIFFVEDPEYQLGTSKYVQVLDAEAGMANDGAGAYDYKHVVKQIDPESGETRDIYNKEYEKLTSIRVYKRSEKSEAPREDARCCIGCTAVPAVVTYKGKPVTEKLKFRFVSEVEERAGSTNYLTEGEGILYANLLEDIVYMVYLDSDKYVMDPFPIVVKDKSEYGEGRYAYNHTTCVRVDAEHPVRLYDTVAEAKNDTSLSDPNPSVKSLKGGVTVSGMSFRHLLILDRSLGEDTIEGLSGSDHAVFDVTAVNPHRWEISKIKGTDFKITKKIPHDKLVTHVYYAETTGSYSRDTDAAGAGKLKEIKFTQKSPDEISFTIDGLSLYRLAVVYDSNKTYSQKVADDKAAADAVKNLINGLPAASKVTTADKNKIDKARAAYNALTSEQKEMLSADVLNKLTIAEKAYIEAKKVQDAKAAAEAKAKKVKTVTVNVATVNAKAIDKVVKKKGGSNKYVTKIVLGKKVKKISAKAFAKYKKVTTIELKTKKLKKKAVKNSLKGSKVKTVKVKVGSKKINKKYVKKYKKIFTKKNAGKKVTTK